MKILGYILLTASIIACDPYGFGFKNNPAFVLDEAFKSIQNLDTATFLEVTGKEALCVYGNAEGLTYLKEKVVINPENVKILPKMLSSKYPKSPQFVGYWSYFSESYQIDILDKVSKEVVIQAIVDCHYGTEGQKEDRLKNLNRKKYKKKECRLTKIIPKKFGALPIPAKCDVMRVTL